MSYFDTDAKAMLEVYCLEATQLMEQLDTILHETQKRKGFTKEEVNSIFRIMHTIKSSSAMMGLTGISSAAHKLEDIFALLRSGKKSCENPGEALFQVLFAFSDHLAKELERMAEDTYIPAGLGSIEESINTCLLGSAAETKADTEPSGSVPLNSGEDGAVFRIYFQKECKMENVRAYMLINRLNQSGIECQCYPDHPEKSHQAADYIHENGFYLKVSSEEAAQAEPILRDGLFVASCEIVGKQVPAAPKPKAPVAQEYLKIRMDQLDNLQKLTGEMRILLSSLHMELAHNRISDIDENVGHQMDIIMEHLEQTVIDMRMVKLKTLIPKFRRIVREICRSEGKEAELTFSGGDMEADKNVVDFISEAVTHILRNSLDHGIGTPKERKNQGKPPKGSILLEAEISGGELTIRISDDGKGMDLARIRETARERGLFERPEEEYSDHEILELTMLPGFSTKEEVTEYSGRGVGLDVVKKKTEELGGHLRLSSHKGEGTTFRIRVPMTLASSDCVRFFIDEYQFALPGKQVEHFFSAAMMRGAGDNSAFVIYNNKKIPVLNLRKFYRLESSEISPDSVLIYIKNQDAEVCITADSVIGRGKVVQQPLSPLLGSAFRQKTGILNFSIMGDGNICFHLDIGNILNRFGKGCTNEV